MIKIIKCHFKCELWHEIIIQVICHCYKTTLKGRQLMPADCISNIGFKHYFFTYHCPFSSTGLCVMLNCSPLTPQTAVNLLNTDWPYWSFQITFSNSTIYRKEICHTKNKNQTNKNKTLLDGSQLWIISPFFIPVMPLSNLKIFFEDSFK